LALMEVDFDVAISNAFRDALMRGGAIYLDRFEILNEKEDIATKRAAFFNGLKGFDGIAFVASRDGFKLDEMFNENLFKIYLPVPEYPIRKKIWQGYLNGKFPDEAISELAAKFRFTWGQIKDSIMAAESLAVLNGRERVTMNDLHEGCKAQSNQKLSALARKIESRYKWEDIILPDDKTEQLKEIKSHIKNRGLVYNDWGFEKKLSLGRGLNALFLGPSGTGKTMAAEVMASELGLDLYKIDLSAMISKYIGETEKNLSKIFKEAEQNNAILFFDEADALFGKRSEVRDSHDRYANVEISYLLQKIEEHDGVVIMASNLSTNIDDAFIRRMHFTVEFPFPDEGYRLKIWKSLIPERAPMAKDIDFDFMARKFSISGGNIKNIMVNAAFLAADDSKVIKMEHIVAATKREYQKMKKVCSQSDFGKYNNLA
jgi:SpoVK/Ycf46/Vps4 family AAA+-type ATPase